MKITEKVAFNIASEASYVYILNGQKLNKNAQKLVENAKVQKLDKLTNFGIFDELLSIQNVNVARFACNVECDFFGRFSNTVSRPNIFSNL